MVRLSVSSSLGPDGDTPCSPRDQLCLRDFETFSSWSESSRVKIVGRGDVPSNDACKSPSGIACENDSDYKNCTQPAHEWRMRKTQSARVWHLCVSFKSCSLYLYLQNQENYKQHTVKVPDFGMKKYTSQPITAQIFLQEEL